MRVLFAAQKQGGGWIYGREEDELPVGQERWEVGETLERLGCEA